MPTINADSHELMRRFDMPGEEKRMVVILEEAGSTTPGSTARPTA
jgi:hypothetical protein